jgi:hypothetical protein
VRKKEGTNKGKKGRKEERKQGIKKNERNARK